MLNSSTHWTEDYDAVNLTVNGHSDSYQVYHSSGGNGHNETVYVKHNVAVSGHIQISAP